MTKKLSYLCRAGLVIGLFVLVLSRVFRENLSDFSLGFCEGFSLSLIIIGTICMCWLFIKKKDVNNITVNKESDR